MKIFSVTTIILFIVSVFAIEMVSYAYRNLRKPNRGKIRKRLRSDDFSESEGPSTDILRKSNLLSNVPFLNDILSRIPGIHRLDLLMKQANVKRPLSVFVLVAVVLALSGYYFTSSMTGNTGLSFLIGAVLGGLPFYYVHAKKRNRMDKFQRQLPEGLDLIARGLRAGHAFSTGLKLASDSFEDPLGPEFAETLDEINFGVSVPDALKNLASRIDCPDLKFFVISVIVQRETGGNLAEIIESIASILRERFTFQDKVRVLSAEAKFSAKVLVGLPFVILIALRLMNPDYVNILFTDPMGKIILSVAAFMMVIGILVMARMVKIKV